MRPIGPSVAAMLVAGGCAVCGGPGGCVCTGQDTPAAVVAQPTVVAGKRWPDAPLRGICTTVCSSRGEGLDERAFQKFKEWNINLIRVGISVDPGSPWHVKKGATLPPIPADDPLRPYVKHLDGLRIALELAAKYQVFVIPTVGDVVGRNNDVMYQSSDGAGFYGQVLVLWRDIARRHGANPWLLGYDILNEPHGSESESWRDDIAPRLVKAIREIDTDTYIVYEPAPWALPDQGFSKLTPLEDPKIVYSMHFYYPHSYTHQGIHSYKGPEYEGKAYPGELRLFGDSPKCRWDKARLEGSMANVVAFQEKYHARIWVGEFSAIRWAPGAADWVQDAVDIFEKYGWSWCFHCYGEWNGWNPTFAADDPEGNQPDGGRMTDRLVVLRKAWDRNTPGTTP